MVYFTGKQAEFKQILEEYGAVTVRWNEFLADYNSGHNNDDDNDNDYGYDYDYGSGNDYDYDIEYDYDYE